MTTKLSTDTDSSIVRQQLITYKIVNDGLVRETLTRVFNEKDYTDTIDIVVL